MYGRARLGYAWDKKGVCTARFNAAKKREGGEGCHIPHDQREPRTWQNTPPARWLHRAVLSPLWVDSQGAPFHTWLTGCIVQCSPLYGLIAKVSAFFNILHICAVARSLCLANLHLMGATLRNLWPFINGTVQGECVGAFLGHFVNIFLPNLQGASEGAADPAERSGAAWGSWLWLMEWWLWLMEWWLW